MFENDYSNHEQQAQLSTFTLELEDEFISFGAFQEGLRFDRGTWFTCHEYEGEPIA
jgi:hypothetical protein